VVFGDGYDLLEELVAFQVPDLLSYLRLEFVFGFLVHLQSFLSRSIKYIVLSFSWQKHPLYQVLYPGQVGFITGRCSFVQEYRMSSAAGMSRA